MSGPARAPGAPASAERQTSAGTRAGGTAPAAAERKQGTGKAGAGAGAEQGTNAKKEHSANQSAKASAASAAAKQQQPGAKAGPLASPAGAAPIAVTESYALPGSLYTVQWSAEEQKILDDTMSKLPQEKYTPLQRYIQVAAQLPNKGVRDVALRVRWIQKRVRRFLVSLHVPFIRFCVC